MMAEAAAESGRDEAVGANQVDEHLGGAAVHLRKLALQRGRGANRSVEVASWHREYSTLLNYLGSTIQRPQARLHLPHGRPVVGRAHRVGTARRDARLLGLLH